MPGPDEHSDEDRSNWSFGQLLEWHLERGTRPSGDRAKWKREVFAADLTVSTNAIFNWIKKGAWPEPHRVRRIAELLFGDAPSLQPLRAELESAYRHRVSGGGTHPSLVRWLLRGPASDHLLRHSAEYDRARHELIRRSVEYRLAPAFTKLHFQAERGPMMDHGEFAHVAASYLRDIGESIDAFSRSTVTDWSKINPASNEFLSAQRGKRVRRVFVLSTLADYTRYSESVFPRHAEAYGAENVLVASSRLANAALRKMPEGLAPAQNTDFAIIDDTVVAFCSGPSDVCFRTDNLEGCRMLFATVSEAVAGQSYAALSQDPGLLSNVFK